MLLNVRVITKSLNSVLIPLLVVCPCVGVYLQDLQLLCFLDRIKLVSEKSNPCEAVMDTRNQEMKKLKDNLKNLLKETTEKQSEKNMKKRNTRDEGEAK